MRRRHWSAFCLVTMMLCAAAARGQAQVPAATPSQPAATQPAPSGPLYVVTYFEVAPVTSRQTAGLLRQFAAATRNESGNLEFTALRELGRTGRFAIVEAWQDKSALDAHAAAMTTLGEKLQPSFLSPFDARQFWTLSVVASAPGVDTGNAIIVLTHIDVFPAGKEQVAAMVRQLADDSRKDRGAVRFDAVIQEGRPNHFHLIEAWSSRPTRAAHALADHTRQFRAKLVPFEGALYDERLYEVIR